LRAADSVARWPQVSPSSPKRKMKAPTCDECFFRCKALCALERDAPCSTFRANGPHGLVPPRQPALLLRDPGQEVALNDSLAQPA
jgi:hypothetical protein